MVTTGNKHAVATSGMDDAWRGWMRLPNDQRAWVRWKTMWGGDFLEKHELIRLTGITYNGMANQAADMGMGNTIVVSLDNLANVSVQKNDTIERHVIYKLSLSDSLTARNTKIARVFTIITNLSTGGRRRRRRRRGR